MGIFGIIAGSIRKAANWIRNKVRNIYIRIRTFFINVISWLDTSYHVIESSINAVIDFSQAFLQVIDGVLKKFSYNYVIRENNQWDRYKAASSKIISINEVPEEFRNRASQLSENEILEISDNVNNEMKLIL
ncbi:MAG: hypothetical protein ACI4J2_10175 [Ruminococcus sp.]